MLTHPTRDRLRKFGLHGMAKGFHDLAGNPESQALGHVEWLGILLERESTLRQQKRFEAAPRLLSCVIWPQSMMSITGRRVAWIAPCF